MARLWRISNYADLSGLGGLRFSARWHSRGRPIIYAAESPAGAMTEMLVHLDRDLMPDTFRLIEIALEPGAVVAEVRIADLPAGWRADVRVTRGVGDAWLAGASSPALRVPSLIVPETWNVLLNPLHPDAGAMKIARVLEAPLDERLRS